MGTTKEKRTTERNFHAKFVDKPAPEDIVIARMIGNDSLMHEGKQFKISEKGYQAALSLLPYRLPKLNSIDAEVKQVEMSHDEWIAQLDSEAE